MSGPARSAAPTERTILIPDREARMPRIRSRRPAASTEVTETPEVAVSAELSAPVSPGVELCYQTFGDPAADPLLLVMGLGGPMTWWDPAFCRMLPESGFFVIR